MSVHIEGSINRVKRCQHTTYLWRLQIILGIFLHRFQVGRGMETESQQQTLVHNEAEEEEELPNTCSLL
jgi:hypothetical protein